MRIFFFFLDISGLPTGLYIFMLKDGNKDQTGRFLIPQTPHRKRIASQRFILRNTRIILIQTAGYGPRP